MTNFLTNLARRSAGLAPVVAARVSPVAGVGEGGGAEPETPPRVPPPNVLLASVAAAPAAPTHIYTDTAAPPAPTAAVMPHGVPEPSFAAKPVTPAEAVVRETARVITHTTIIAPVAATPVRGPIDSPAPLLAMRNAPGEPREPTRIDTRGDRDDRSEPRRAETRVEPSRDEESPPRTPDTAPPLTRLTSLREIFHHVEQRVEPAMVVAPPAPIAVQPASARVAEANLPDAQPVETRIVQVRIGAIEIHGAAPPVAASAAPAPPAAATRAAPVGFDGFARLRSYAPWEW